MGLRTLGTLYSAHVNKYQKLEGTCKFSMMFTKLKIHVFRYATIGNFFSIAFNFIEKSWEYITFHAVNCIPFTHKKLHLIFIIFFLKKSMFIESISNDKPL